MSVANRDTLLDIALNTAGINQAVAKPASHKHTTIMNKKNPFKWQERWQTLATPNRKPKIGLMGLLEKVTR